MIAKHFYRPGCSLALTDPFCGYDAITSIPALKYQVQESVPIVASGYHLQAACALDVECNEVDQPLQLLPLPDGV